MGVGGRRTLTTNRNKQSASRRQAARGGGESARALHDKRTTRTSNQPSQDDCNEPARQPASLPPLAALRHCLCSLPALPSPALHCPALPCPAPPTTHREASYVRPAARGGAGRGSCDQDQPVLQMLAGAWCTARPTTHQHARARVCVCVRACVRACVSASMLLQRAAAPPTRHCTARADDTWPPGQAGHNSVSLALQGQL